MSLSLEYSRPASLIVRHLLALAPIVIGVLLYGCGSKNSFGPAPAQGSGVSQPSVDVRQYGARGDDTVDDTGAFAAALRALPAEGGTVSVPAGVYLFRAAKDGAASRAIDLTGRFKITIAGAGMHNTVLRMAPSSHSGDTHFVLLDRATDIVIRDLSIDGNRENVTYSDEQSHGVEIRNSQDVRLERVLSRGMHGDGVRLIGRTGGNQPWTERVVIDDSRFEDNGRSGVAMQRGVRHVEIRDNTFERISDQSISAEPSGSGSPTDIWIEGNLIRHSTRPWAVAVGGIKPSDVARRITFKGNRVENGAVMFLRMDDLLVEGNTILGGTGHSALRLSHNVTNAEVIDNDVSGGGGEEGVVQVVALKNAQPFHVIVRNNRIRANPNMSGLVVRDAVGNISILQNEIHSESGKIGILVTNTVVRNTARSIFTVFNNSVQNYKIGISLSTSGDPFSTVLVQANSLDHEQRHVTESIGILFDKTGPYEVFATVTSNKFGPGIRRPIHVGN